jgi:hypothetical protein
MTFIQSIGPLLCLPLTEVPEGTVHMFCAVIYLAIPLTYPALKNAPLPASAAIQSHLLQDTRAWPTVKRVVRRIPTTERGCIGTDVRSS